MSDEQMTGTPLRKDDDQSPKVVASYLVAIANLARAKPTVRRSKMANLACNGSHLVFKIFMMLVLEAAIRNEKGVMLKHCASNSHSVKWACGSI